MHIVCTLIASHFDSHFNPTADCGAPLPPVNGSLLQSHTNTTEGSVVVFQCDPGFVPEGEMISVCGSDGQWTPDPGDVTCSFVLPTVTSSATGPGENKCMNNYLNHYR